MCCLSINGQGLKQWAKQKQAEKKTEIPIVQSPSFDESKIYKSSIVDKKLVFTGFEMLRGLSDETIFVNALVWAINNSSKLKDDFIKIDYQKMSFECNKIYQSTNQKEPTTFRMNYSVRVSDNMLTFLVSDILAENPGPLSLVKKQYFDKLNVEKKPKHAQLLNEFTTINSGVLNSMFKFIKTNRLPTITHWNEISQNIVVNGMNQIEALLSYGKPIDSKKTDNREQWMFGNSIYLFFTDGLVTSVLR